MAKLKSVQNYINNSKTGILNKIVTILAIIFLNKLTIAHPSFQANLLSDSRNDSTWIQENTWHLWKQFNNLFVFNDSLYCTYSLTVFETNLLVRRDTIDYYQWFPIYNAPFIKIIPNDNIIEAWTSKGYMRTYNLIDWEELPNPDNDLSWCAIKWKNYTVWRLEEHGRSGVIYINENEYIFEEVVPEVDVFALGTNNQGYLFAALKNNKIYKKSNLNEEWQEYRVFAYNIGKIRLIKFFDDKEYVGSDSLYLNGSVILDCVPSSIELINGIYYLSTYDKGMFISYDGITFKPWNDGIKDFNVWSVIVYNDFIYAATRNGIFKRRLLL